MTKRVLYRPPSLFDASGSLLKCFVQSILQCDYTSSIFYSRYLRNDQINRIVQSLEDHSAPTSWNKPKWVKTFAQVKWMAQTLLSKNTGLPPTASNELIMLYLESLGEKWADLLSLNLKKKHKMSDEEAVAAAVNLLQVYKANPGVLEALSSEIEALIAEIGPERLYLGADQFSFALTSRMTQSLLQYLSVDDIDLKQFLMSYNLFYEKKTMEVLQSLFSCAAPYPYRSNLFPDDPLLLLLNEAVCKKRHFVDIVMRTSRTLLVEGSLDKAEDFISPLPDLIIPLILVEIDSLRADQQAFQDVLKKFEYAKSQIPVFNEVFTRFKNDFSLMKEIHRLTGTKISIDDLTTMSLPFALRNILKILDTEQLLPFRQIELFSMSDVDVVKDFSFMFAFQTLAEALKQIESNNVDGRFPAYLSLVQYEDTIVTLAKDLYSLIFLKDSEGSFICPIEIANLIIDTLISLQIDIPYLEVTHKKLQIAKNCSLGLEKCFFPLPYLAQNLLFVDQISVNLDDDTDISEVLTIKKQYKLFEKDDRILLPTLARERFYSDWYLTHPDEEISEECDYSDVIKRIRSDNAIKSLPDVSDLSVLTHEDVMDYPILRAFVDSMGLLPFYSENAEFSLADHVRKVVKSEEFKSLDDLIGVLGSTALETVLQYCDVGEIPEYILQHLKETSSYAYEYIVNTSKHILTRKSDSRFDLLKFESILLEDPNDLEALDDLFYANPSQFVAQLKAKKAQFSEDILSQYCGTSQYWEQDDYVLNDQSQKMDKIETSHNIFNNPTQIFRDHIEHFEWLLENLKSADLTYFDISIREIIKYVESFTIDSVSNETFLAYSLRKLLKRIDFINDSSIQNQMNKLRAVLAFVTQTPFTRYSTKYSMGNFIESGDKFYAICLDHDLIDTARTIQLAYQLHESAQPAISAFTVAKYKEGVELLSTSSTIKKQAPETVEKIIRTLSSIAFLEHFEHSMSFPSFDDFTTELTLSSPQITALLESLLSLNEHDKLISHLIRFSSFSEALLHFKQTQAVTVRKFMNNFLLPVVSFSLWNSFWTFCSRHEEEFKYIYDLVPSLVQFFGTLDMHHTILDIQKRTKYYDDAVLTSMIILNRTQGIEEKIKVLNTIKNIIQTSIVADSNERGTKSNSEQRFATILRIELQLQLYSILDQDFWDQFPDLEIVSTQEKTLEMAFQLLMRMELALCNEIMNISCIPAYLLYERAVDHLSSKGHGVLPKFYHALSKCNKSDAYPIIQGLSEAVYARSVGDDTFIKFITSNVRDKDLRRSILMHNCS